MGNDYLKFVVDGPVKQATNGECGGLMVNTNDPLQPLYFTSSVMDQLRRIKSTNHLVAEKLVVETMGKRDVLPDGIDDSGESDIPSTQEDVAQQQRLNSGAWIPLTSDLKLPASYGPAIDPIRQLVYVVGGSYDPKIFEINLATNPPMVRLLVELDSSRTKLVMKNGGQSNKSNEDFKSAPISTTSSNSNSISTKPSHTATASSKSQPKPKAPRRLQTIVSSLAIDSARQFLFLGSYDFIWGVDLVRSNVRVIIDYNTRNLPVEIA